jgi:hypothetical protein
MFIVWGSRRTERILGYVADFCPVCREARAFRLVRVGLASHVYYISFGAGRHVGHVIRCEECGSSFDTDATRYATFEKQRPVHLPELGRDSLLVGAGFAIQCSETFSTYFYYDGELGRENYDRHGVSGGVRVAF